MSESMRDRISESSNQESVNDTVRVTASESE